MLAPALNKIEEARILKYDSALQIRWNGQTNRWELWRRGMETGKPVLLVILENADGSYRPVDSRLFEYLVNHDFWRMGKSTKDIAREMQEYEDLKAKKKRDAIVDETGQKASYYRKFFARTQLSTAR